MFGNEQFFSCFDSFLVTSFKGPDDEVFNQVLKKQKLGPTTELTTKTDFPTQSWQPKVQTPFYVPPGEVPRKIEIERSVLVQCCLIDYASDVALFFFLQLPLLIETRFDATSRFLYLRHAQLS